MKNPGRFAAFFSGKPRKSGKNDEDVYSVPEDAYSRSAGPRDMYSEVARIRDMYSVPGDVCRKEIVKIINNSHIKR